MAVPQRDIDLVRGDAYDHTIILGDGADAFTYAAQIRLDPTSTGTPDATFAIDTTDLVSANTIVLSLEAADTQALLSAKTYRWDLQRTDAGGRPFTILGGKVTVEQDVTH